MSMIAGPEEELDDVLVWVVLGVVQGSVATGVDPGEAREGGRRWHLLMIQIMPCFTSMLLSPNSE